jgi:hypothetical protein
MKADPPFDRHELERAHRGAGCRNRALLPLNRPHLYLYHHLEIFPDDTPIKKQSYIRFASIAAASQQFGESKGLPQPARAPDRAERDATDRAFTYGGYKARQSRLIMIRESPTLIGRWPPWTTSNPHPIHDEACSCYRDDGCSQMST